MNRNRICRRNSRGLVCTAVHIGVNWRRLCQPQRLRLSLLLFHREGAPFTKSFWTVTGYVTQQKTKQSPGPQTPMLYNYMSDSNFFRTFLMDEDKTLYEDMPLQVKEKRCLKKLTSLLKTTISSNCRASRF